ncbi:MAG: hypothetical protein HON23_05900 [Rickettsiales bacterium]|nr:hypothetical protein [Rickettsiales bacterium]
MKNNKLSTENQEYYDFNSVVDLVSNKLGYKIRSQQTSHTGDDHRQYIKILSIINSLNKYLFFEVYSNNNFLNPGEGIYQKEGANLNIKTKLSIPKEQIDYVLETGRRFCDKEQSKYPNIFIYKAQFGTNLAPVVTRFNKNEAIKIERTINISDFEGWIKNNTLTKEQAFLVMLGINPEYYQSLLSYERQELERRKLLLDDDSSFQLNLINDFIDNFKSINWSNDWEQLIGRLYQEAVILHPTFQSRCHKFMTYIKDSGLLTSDHFDKYLDYTLYRPDYDQYFDRSDLSEEEIIFLVKGLDPVNAYKYISFSDIVSQNEGYYKALDSEEDIFFFKCYSNFLEENFIFIFRYKEELMQMQCDGSLKNSVSNLYNKGVIFSAFFMDYLKVKNTLPEYEDNTALYKELLLYSSMRFWSLEDIYNLVQGISLLNKKQLFYFCNEQSANEYRISKIGEHQRYIAVLNIDGEFHEIEDLIQRCCDTVDGGYLPREVLKWLIDYTLIIPPALLVKLVFKNDSKEIQEVINDNENLVKTLSFVGEERFKKIKGRLDIKLSRNAAIEHFYKEEYESRNYSLIGTCKDAVMLKTQYTSAMEKYEFDDHWSEKK